MSSFAWIVQSEAGEDLRTVEPFDTKEEAEAWMGREWQTLVDEGGGFVVLTSGDETLYRMSLAEA